MAKQDERFEVIQSEGNTLTNFRRQVLLDKATGVQYLLVVFGNSAGLCPLLDRDGKPLCWNSQ